MAHVITKEILHKHTYCDAMVSGCKSGRRYIILSLLGCTETESDSLPTNEGITTKIYVYSTKTYITCRLYKHVFHTVKSHLVTTSL